MGVPWCTGPIRQEMVSRRCMLIKELAEDGIVVLRRVSMVRDL